MGTVANNAVKELNNLRIQSHADVDSEHKNSQDTTKILLASENEF